MPLLPVSQPGAASAGLQKAATGAAQEDPGISRDADSDGSIAESLPAAGQGDTEAIHHVQMQPDSSDPELGTTRASLGADLRATRERKGWTRQDVGARLKLPVRLIERLELDDYAGMTQGVYLRGYLTSYARLLDLPLDSAKQVADAHVEAIPLVATGTTSHSRYLFDRYSVSATYLILTALIVAPAVWLATHGGLEQNLARNMPLDTALVANDPAQQDDAFDISNRDAGEHGSAAAANSSPVDPPPIISSLASFPTLPKQSGTLASNPPPHVATTSGTADTEPAHRFTLKLTAGSWVEILDAKGERVEYGLLPAGTQRSYDANGPLSVHIGNAEGVEMSADGEPVALEPYRRANVARLTLFDADTTPEAPRSE